MPLVAVAVRFKASYDEINREIDRAIKRELTAKAKEVLTEARASIRSSKQHSSPGHPFASRTGATKRLLGMKVGKRTAFVGFKREKPTRDKKTGRDVKPARVVPNILEHGSRRMAARPVLEPALERVRNSPWRGTL